MKFIKRVCCGMLLATMLLVGRIGNAQAIYGSLFGTVLDNTGAVVPNAKVTVTDVSKGTQTVVTSNGEGDWRPDNLNPPNVIHHAGAEAVTAGRARDRELLTPDSPSRHL